MPNIYYCQPSRRGWGMLRAVPSLEEGMCLLKLNAFHYVGQEFPAPIVDSPTDIAILRIFDKEPNEEYRAGFYCFDADLVQIESAVRSCTIQH